MRIFPYLLPLILLAAVSCYAQPNAEDAERVKNRFLLLRFQAPLTKEYRGLGDKELFEISCAQNRVRCGELLEILKKNDPEFYRILSGGENL